jgi:hypothetical protein
MRHQPFSGNADSRKSAQQVTEQLLPCKRFSKVHSAHSCFIESNDIYFAGSVSFYPIKQPVADVTIQLEKSKHPPDVTVTTAACRLPDPFGDNVRGYSSNPAAR